MWPGWSKSKQPFVKTTRRPLRLSRPNRRIVSARVRIPGCKRSSVKSDAKTNAPSAEEVVYHARENGRISTRARR